MIDPRTLLFGLVCTSLACAPGIPRRDSGVAVGNPGNLRASLSPGDDVDFAEARMHIQELWLVRCDDSGELVAEDVWLELRADDALEIPRGKWCGLVSGPLWVEATPVGSAGDLPELAFEVDGLELYGKSWSTAEGDVAVRLASEGWVSAEELRFVDEELEDELAEVILDDSALVRDDGADGADDGDLELATAYSEPEWEAEEPVVRRSSGCGQEEVYSGQGAVGLLWLGLGLRRRRSARNARQPAASQA